MKLDIKFAEDFDVQEFFNKLEEWTDDGIITEWKLYDGIITEWEEWEEEMKK